MNCSTCQKSFFNSASLKRHLKTKYHTKKLNTSPKHTDNPKYNLGNNKFRTKKEIVAYVKNILHINCDGYLLEGEELEVMKDLIQWHPKYDPAWGNEFKIEDNARGSKNFMIKDIDSQWWDFSFYKCIARQNKQQNHRKNVIRTFRETIREQIYEFKDSKKCYVDGKVMYTCEIDGKMYDRDSIHVDHKYDSYTFRQLHTDFLKLHKLNFEDIQLRQDRCFIYFHDDKIKQSWLDFHKNNAILRVINKTSNLTAKRS